MYHADLEALAARELRRLPVPQAPPSLLPRVLAAVHEWSTRPWYARAWFTWPLGWQFVSVMALVLILVGGSRLMPDAEALAGLASSKAAGPVSEVMGVVQRAVATTTAARVVWRALLEPVAAYAFALVALMGLACAALGTMLNRVALGTLGTTLRTLQP